MPKQTLSTTTTTDVPRTSLREIPLSRIVVADGFNPRQEIPRDEQFAALVARIRDRGILQPIRVRETGTGDYVIVSGHRRYAAAIDADSCSCPAF